MSIAEGLCVSLVALGALGVSAEGRHERDASRTDARVPRIHTQRPLLLDFAVVASTPFILTSPLEIDVSIPAARSMSLD